MCQYVAIPLQGPSVTLRIQSLGQLSAWRVERAQKVQPPETAVPQGDSVSLSAEAEAALARDEGDETATTPLADDEAQRAAAIYTARGRDAGAPGSPGSVDEGEAASPVEPQPATPAEDTTVLTEPEQEEVKALKTRDAEVRRQQQAHAARVGSYASSPQYKYETGPDGRRYIVDGSVSIDVAKVDGDVKATLRKMETLIGAATAEDYPSPQDRAVARAARALALEARAELSARAVGRDPIEADEVSDVFESSEARPVEDSEAYAAATRPPRPHVSPPSESLQTYRENARPLVEPAQRGPP